MKAKEIQWRHPEKFDDIVIRMGGFHIALNYLAVIGKMFKRLGTFSSHNLVRYLCM